MIGVTMNKDEALKMAIEALKEAEDIIEGKTGQGGYFAKPINACKEALEQPAQKPVAWMYENDVTKAYFETKESSLVLEYGCKETPLYTHPKQWQGLTTDELEDIKDNSKEGWYQLVRNVEQALKEKNT
jgi:hypothetical protein